MKVGDKITARNPCVMKSTGAPTLTVGKEYTVIKIWGRHGCGFDIKDDDGNGHGFERNDFNDYFMPQTQGQYIDDYFKMLGEVFEWICYESDDEVELSSTYKEGNEFKMKSDYFENGKSALCIGTIKSACRAFDNKNGTDYYDKFMFAKDNGVKHHK